MQLYVSVHTVLNPLYDYEPESSEYRTLKEQYDQAYSLYLKLTAKIVEILSREVESADSEKGLHYKIEPFMNRNGFENRNGWWIHKEDEE